MSSPRAAIVGAVVVMMSVVAAALFVGDRHGESPGASDPTARPGRPVAVEQLDQVARRAPCRLAVRDPHPASARQVNQFVAAAVVRCVSSRRVYRGAGEWEVVLRQVSVSRLRPLLRALTLPDQRSSADQVCTAIGYGPLNILLADARGRYLHPAAPSTACGAPQPALLHALTAMRWRTVSVSKVQQTRTADSLASGCDMQWKNEPAIYGRSGVRSGSGGTVFTHSPSDSLRVCLYSRANDPNSGTFRRSVTVGGAPAQRLRGALSRPGPSGDCNVQPNFAVIRNSGNEWVNLELGGCWRVVRDDRNPVRLGSADSTIVRNVLHLP